MKQPSNQRPEPTEPTIWEKAYQELASDPESPASLQIISAVRSAMLPSSMAIEQLVEALADQIQLPGASADAAVKAAIAAWESACRGALDEDTMQLFREDAVKLVRKRQRRPPALESILAAVGDTHDVGYIFFGSLGGLHGTWHRLWATISLEKVWPGNGGPTKVGDLRKEFETLLGRAMTAFEWQKLTAHAERHAETVMHRFSKTAANERRQRRSALSQERLGRP